MIGQSIGNYKILEKLSQAETVEVYKGVDILLSRNVLIKVLGRDFLNQSDIAEDLRFEAATLGKFSHSGIPTLYSLTDADDSLFMVLGFTDGEMLDKVLRRRGKLSFEEAVPIFVKVLDSLEYSHKFAVAHGNIKTSNIVLTDTGTVKILGYGKREHFQSSETSDDISMKRATASGNDASDDIYAVGAMLFETVTGKSLLDFENSLQVKGKPTEEMRKYLYSVNPFIPEEIKSAIIKAVLPNRTERFQTASAFRDILPAYGFDDSKVEEEIIASEKLIADTLPFTRLQTFGLTDNLGISTENLTIVPSEIVSNNKNVAVYSVDFSHNENKTREKKSNLKRIAVNEQSDSQIKPSLLRNPPHSHSMILGAGILAILVLHFIWQFYFIQSENLEIAATLIKTEQIGKQVVETKPEYEAKNQDFVKPPKIALPVEPPQLEIKPSQTVLKKKVPLESRAERLRRVEKALTGI